MCLTAKTMPKTEQPNYISLMWEFSKSQFMFLAEAKPEEPNIAFPQMTTGGWFLELQC